MEQKTKKLLPGQRCDGYVSAYTPSGNPIREKWIHKKVVKSIGDGEDDYVLEEKAVCIEKANIQKEIEAQAKACPSIKELVKQVMETDDESILQQVNGTYGDVSDMPNNLHQAIKIVNDAKSKGMNLDNDEILHMSKSDIEKYISDAVNKVVEANKPKVEDKVEPKGDGE